jgi:glycosyltransferase involved in cell wall biosynthesis
MKIIFTALGFGIGDNLGGSATVSGTNAIELAKKGHEVIFLCTNRVDKKSKLYNFYTKKIIKNVKVIYLDTRTIPFWKGDFGPHFVQIPNFVKNYIKNCDIIHCNEHRSYLTLYVTYFANKFKKPIIMQPHGTLHFKHDNASSERPLIKALYDLLLDRILKIKYSAFLALTEKEKKIFINSGIDDNLIYVIPNAIKDFDFNLCDKKFINKIINNSDPYILSIGRSSPLKGFHLSISALKFLPKRYRLVIIGPDQQNYTHNLKELAKNEGVFDRVHFLGEFNKKKDIYSAMIGADIFLHSSLADAFPMVTLESALSKTPLIITNCCNHINLFPKNSIMIVKPTIDDIASKCLFLIKNNNQKMVENTYEFVSKNFTYKNIVPLIENMYNEIIENYG